MKVVIAVDDSPYSQEMLDLLCRRRWPADTQFKVLLVIEPINNAPWDGDGWVEMNEEMNRRRQNFSEKLCVDARHKIENSVPGSIVHYEIRNGNPKEEIIFSATAWEANRIILGARSRAVCPHNSLGGVSRGVAEHAHCTVEVIRAKLPSLSHSKAPAAV